jgi:hypothetical protein
MSIDGGLGCALSMRRHVDIYITDDRLEDPTLAWNAKASTPVGSILSLHTATD